MIENTEIIGCLCTKEKLNRLEEIIAEDTKEYNALPFSERWIKIGKKVITQEQADKLFSEAKQDTDGFLCIDSSVYSPSVKYIKRFTGRMSPVAYLLHAAAICSGIAVVTIGNMPVLGGIIAYGGMAGFGASMAIIKTRTKKPHSYCLTDNRIDCVSGREQEIKCALLHEYAHCVLMDKIGSAESLHIFNEGFAEGLSIYLMSQSSISMHKRTGLFQSIWHMVIAREAIKKRIEGKSGHFNDMLEKINEKNLREKELILSSGMGYAFFRLAEEKRGSEIYREVLEGNYSPLLS